MRPSTLFWLAVLVYAVIASRGHAIVGPIIGGVILSVVFAAIGGAWRRARDERARRDELVRQQARAEWARRELERL